MKTGHLITSRCFHYRTEEKERWVETVDKFSLIFYCLIWTEKEKEANSP